MDEAILDRRSEAGAAPTGRILPDLRAEAAMAAAGIAALRSRRRGRQPKISSAQMLAMNAEGLTIEQMMERTGSCRAAVARARKAAGIVTPQAERRRRAQSRMEPRALAFYAAAKMPPVDHPALTEKRTIYPATVVPVEGLLHLLVEGVNAWKIGGEIQKGKWLGFRVYTLTLEERATCPVSCAHWRSCYGNHMHLAKRIVAGAALEERLEHELAVLNSRYPTGFAVRLHVLGDFYSVEYVNLWASFLRRFPALHVFGFTARTRGDDPIALALMNLVASDWDRFAIRFSNAPVEERSTVSIEHPLQKPDDAVICPQQLGQTQSCSTCGLCWQSTRRVAFLRH